MKKLLLIATILISVALNAQDTSKNTQVIQPINVIIDSFFVKTEYPSPPPHFFDPIDYWHPQILFDPDFFNDFIFPVFVLESLYNKKGAKRDIKANKMQVLFSSGPVGPALEFKSKEDKAFQKKYHVEFYTQGCSHFGEKEDEKGYNQTIFAFLDEKYGQEWRFEMRNDAIGFDIPDSLFRKKAEEVLTLLPKIKLKEYVDGLPLKKPTISMTVILGIGVPMLFLSFGTLFFIRRRKQSNKTIE